MEGQAEKKPKELENGNKVVKKPRRNMNDLFGDIQAHEENMQQDMFKDGDAPGTDCGEDDECPVKSKQPKKKNIKLKNKEELSDDDNEMDDKDEALL